VGALSSCSGGLRLALGTLSRAQQHLDGADGQAGATGRRHNGQSDRRDFIDKNERDGYIIRRAQPGGHQPRTACEPSELFIDQPVQ
jgi:hypothetical protein